MNNKGFTLVEFLIYIGIVSVILVSITFLTIESVLLGAKSDDAVMLHSSARFAIGRIEEEVRNATNVNEAASVFDVNPGALSLETASPSTNPTIIDVANGILQIKRGTSNAVPLAPSAIRAARLIFSSYSKPGTPGTIKIIMELAPTNTQNQSSITLEESASLRQ
ncbi:MAG TPA: prepilin-type N-terminal cleavage/methylation domain-containing protein [Candidatus Paceibacterota bacterium]